jgi:hypothetical protein
MVKQYSLKNYIAYLKDNPKGYWFKQRLYGWGWAPAKLQGWLVMLAFLAIVLLDGFYISYRASVLGDPTTLDMTIFFGVLALSIAGIIWVGFKTGEKPDWNWGRVR